MINKIAIIIFLSSTLLFSAESKVVAAISTLKGLVMVKPVGSRKYIPAYKGQMLKSGEWIKTKDGVFVAIVFLDGSNIKIQQQTEVRIMSYRQAAKELRTNLMMSKGQAYSNIANQGPAGEFKITTPTAVASVKGTEFDLEYDIDNDATTVVVLEGGVSLAGELGEILVGAMQSSKNGGKPIALKPEDLPTWQKKTDPKWTFKLKPDRIGKQKVGEVIKVNIQIINVKSKIFDDSFTGIVKVISQTEGLVVSKDCSSWANSIEININRGRGVVQVKSSTQGKSEIIVNSPDSESKLIGFEYYQTKSQKRDAQNKFAEVAKKRGLNQLYNLIKDKNLISSEVISGQSNISEILQKMETGEFNINGDPIIIEEDGTITVKIVVKPR